MKHGVWRLAMLLIVTIAAAGCLFVPMACADDEDDDIRSEEFNVEGAYFHWLETGSDDMVSAVTHLENETTNYVLYEMYGEDGEAMFAEILALKAGLPSTGMQFSDIQQRCINALTELTGEQITALYDLWNHMKQVYEAWEENEEREAAAENEGQAVSAAAEPIDEEEAKRLGDFLAARITGEYTQQQQLAQWFLGQSADNQSAVMTYLANTLSEDEYNEFWSWFMQAYMESCQTQSAGTTDTLNLRGNDWAALTLPGLPAPAQGKLQQTSAVDNKRAGRKVVLAQVEQATFDHWLAEIPAGSSDAPDDYDMTEHPDHDGSAFDANFGPSAHSDGEESYTTYFVSEDDVDADTNPTEVKIEYNAARKTLTISVLDP